MLEARRTRVVLIALLVVAIALITIDFRDGGNSGASSFGGRIFGPVERLGGDVTGAVKGTSGNSSEIANLQQQNDQLRAQLAQAQAAGTDATQLARVLHLSAGKYKVVTGTVIAAGGDYSDTVTINVGIRCSARTISAPCALSTTWSSSAASSRTWVRTVFSVSVLPSRACRCRSRPRSAAAWAARRSAAAAAASSSALPTIARSLSSAVLTSSRASVSVSRAALARLARVSRSGCCAGSSSPAERPRTASPGSPAAGRPRTSYPAPPARPAPAAWPTGPPSPASPARPASPSSPAVPASCAWPPASPAWPPCPV